MLTKQDTKLQLQQNPTFELQVMIFVHCDYRSLSHSSLCMFIFSKSSIISSVINRYYFYNKKTTF